MSDTLSREQVENIELHYFGREGDQLAEGLTISDVRKLARMALRSLDAVAVIASCVKAILALGQINAATQVTAVTSPEQPEQLAPAVATPDVREFRQATLSEALKVMRARLSEHLSPAEKRELEQAAALLAQPAAAGVSEEPFWWWASGSVKRHDPNRDYQVVELADYNKLRHSLAERTDRVSDEPVHRVLKLHNNQLPAVHDCAGEFGPGELWRCRCGARDPAECRMEITG